MRNPSQPFVAHVQEYWDGRLWMFDVVGSTKASYLIDVFRYARARYGVTCFFVDSLAKCGLAEDDYNGQKRFVEALCDFKNETDSTVFLVTHSRKLESEARIVDKMDIKGTGAIADLADVITTLWRNKGKEARPEEKAEEPDAWWYWQKNRNGDFEGAVSLWFEAQTYQFLDWKQSRPKAYLSFIQSLELEREA
jgi:twinkle protein